MSRQEIAVSTCLTFIRNVLNIYESAEDKVIIVFY